MPEFFKPPQILRDFGKVTKLFASPVDADRLIANIPTGGLAKWHHWLMKDEILARAQRQYAKCVARVSLYQEVLGEVPLDDPRNPYYGLIKSQEEYLPAFEVVQPDWWVKEAPVAGKRNYQEHLRAALDTINITVDLRQLCESTEQAYKALFNSKYRRR